MASVRSEAESDDTCMVGMAGESIEIKGSGRWVELVVVVGIPLRRLLEEPLATAIGNLVRSTLGTAGTFGVFVPLFTLTMFARPRRAVCAGMGFAMASSW